ncbi:disease resistance protein RGA2-like [Papaver somniferum]|uniref:disease resistance protein RGA2-like n=1 Tax=Papaver somniferum TaxID=3469 RepID=UPI000E7054DD|nr:disease resistance protein RGA2-like [Papaver somniferum]
MDSPASPSNDLFGFYQDVEELILPNSNNWNTDLLHQLFDDNTSQKIQSLFLDITKDDIMIWMPTKDGKFSVKDTYKHLTMSSSDVQLVLRKQSLSDEKLLYTLMISAWVIWKERCETAFQEWKPPLHDIFKLNVDASFCHDTNKLGDGIMLRTNTGSCARRNQRELRKRSSESGIWRDNQVADAVATSYRDTIITFFNNFPTDIMVNLPVKNIIIASQYIEFSLISSMEEEVGEVSGDLKRLDDTMQRIYAIAAEAEKLQQRDGDVKRWLGMLKDVAYDVENVLAEFSYEILHRRAHADNPLLKADGFFSSTLHYKAIMLLIVTIAQEVAPEIKGDLNKLNDTLRMIYALTSEAERLPQSDDTIEVLRRLKNIAYDAEDILDDFSYELMRRRFEINNNLLLRNMGFFLSSGFCLKDVLREIIGYIDDDDDKHDYDYGSLELMIRQVSKMLNGKKYLLVLDDLWDIEGQDNWERLQYILMCGSHESKVNVASDVLLVTPAYLLQQLSTDECWSIIKEKAFSRGGVLENLKMVNIGKEIARKCCGLPLAARVLGNILCSKTKDIVGWEIDRETIIQLWMAEGFLVPLSSGDISMEDVGNKYFDILLSNCLLQSVENKDGLADIQKCKLHDFVHYLARTIAGDDGCSFSTAKKVASNSETRRLVFDEELPRTFPEVGDYKNRLRTVVAVEAGDCDNIQDVFRNRNLRTLVLHGCSSLSKLPEGIGSLRSFKHLDLSHIGMKKLPISVTSLQNLRTLNVSNCPDFEELPEDIGALEDLLDISHTKVTKLPGSIRSLKRLAKLRLHSCQLKSS